MSAKRFALVIGLSLAGFGVAVGVDMVLQSLLAAGVTLFLCGWVMGELRTEELPLRPVGPRLRAVFADWAVVLLAYVPLAILVVALVVQPGLQFEQYAYGAWIFAFFGFLISFPVVMGDAIGTGMRISRHARAGQLAVTGERAGGDDPSRRRRFRSKA